MYRWYETYFTGCVVIIRLEGFFNEWILSLLK